MHRGASEKVAFTIADSEVKVTLERPRTSEPDARRVCLIDMGRCRETSEVETNRDESSLAKALAPEEIRRGDFVTPLSIIAEYPSWHWCGTDDVLRSRDELVRVRLTPTDEATPLKVVDVCLPFVLVRTPQREMQTLDVRRVCLARLRRSFARKARRALRARARQKNATN